MADTVVGSIAVAIKAKADGLVNGLKQANSSIVTAKNNFTKNFGAIATVSAAAFAAAAFAIKKTVDAASEAEVAQNDLRIAFRNAGVDVEKATARALEFSNTIQQQTGFSDELVSSLQTQLVQFGLTGKAMEVSAQAALDLAAAKKIDLKTAADLVGKAFAGETGTLSRYGIVIDKTIPKSEQYAAVLMQINNAMGGAAQGQMDTFTGKVNLLKEQFGDLMEQVGGLLIPVLTTLVTKLSEGAMIANDFFQNRVKPGVDILRDAVANFGFFHSAIAAAVEALRAAINAVPGMDTALKLMGSSLTEVNTKLDQVQMNLQRDAEAKRANAEVTKATDAAVSQNKVMQEQIRAQQMLAIKQTELQSETVLQQQREAERQAIEKEAEKFTSEMQKQAADRQAKLRAEEEKRMADHKAALYKVNQEFETGITTLMDDNLSSREKRQRVFQQVMNNIQDLVTRSFIEAQVKQTAIKRAEAMKQATADQAPIASGAFKAYAGIPFVGQALAIALIGVAFAYIGKLLKFAHGGEVPGMGSGDTVPSMLSPGERVLTKDQNRMFNAVAAAAMRGGTGGGGNITINISGTFLEGNEAKWQRLIRSKLIPEVNRITQSIPSGPFNRVRGAP